MIESLLLALLAALISLDVTAFGQFMISRPIVVGPLFGYLLGDIKTGIWLGMIVEMVWVNVIPMGASVPPDTTAIAILATIWGLRAMPHQPSAMVLALALAVPAAILFRLVDVAQRYLHVRIARWVQEGGRDDLEKRVSYGVYAGFILFFLKAFMFYALLIYPGTVLTREIYIQLSPFITGGLSEAWRILPVVGLAYMLRNFNGNFLCSKK
jgi:PTS system mannose-specific IIC component